MSQAESLSYAPEDCAWCRGALRTPDGRRCPVCGGRGGLLVAQPALSCAGCRGCGREGRVSDGPPCNRCGGAGWEGVYRPTAAARRLAS